MILLNVSGVIKHPPKSLPKYLSSMAPVRRKRAAGARVQPGAGTTVAGEVSRPAGGRQIPPSRPQTNKQTNSIYLWFWGLEIAVKLTP